MNLNERFGNMAEEDQDDHGAVSSESMVTREQTEAIYAAMMEELGIARKDTLPLENNKGTQGQVDLNALDRDKKANDPRTKEFRIAQKNALARSAWKNAVFDDVNEADLELDNMNYGQSHRQRMKANLEASIPRGGYATRGGRDSARGGGSHSLPRSSRFRGRGNGRNDPLDIDRVLARLGARARLGGKPNDALRRGPRDNSHKPSRQANDTSFPKSNLSFADSQSVNAIPFHQNAPNKGSKDLQIAASKVIKPNNYNQALALASPEEFLAQSWAVKSRSAAIDNENKQDAIKDSSYKPDTVKNRMGFNSVTKMPPTKSFEAHKSSETMATGDPTTASSEVAKFPEAATVTEAFKEGLKPRSALLDSVDNLREGRISKLATAEEGEMLISFSEDDPTPPSKEVSQFTADLFSLMESEFIEEAVKVINEKIEKNHTLQAASTGKTEDSWEPLRPFQGLASSRYASEPEVGDFFNRSGVFRRLPGSTAAHIKEQVSKRVHQSRRKYSVETLLSLGKDLSSEKRPSPQPPETLMSLSKESSSGKGSAHQPPKPVQGLMSSRYAGNESRHSVKEFKSFVDSQGRGPVQRPPGFKLINPPAAKVSEERGESKPVDKSLAQSLNTPSVHAEPEQLESWQNISPPRSKPTPTKPVQGLATSMYASPAAQNSKASKLNKPVTRQTPFVQAGAFEIAFSKDTVSKTAVVKEPSMKAAESNHTNELMGDSFANLPHPELSEVTSASSFKPFNIPSTQLPKPVSKDRNGLMSSRFAPNIENINPTRKQQEVGPLPVTISTEVKKGPAAKEPAPKPLALEEESATRPRVLKPTASHFTPSVGRVLPISEPNSPPPVVSVPVQPIMATIFVEDEQRPGTFKEVSGFLKMGNTPVIGFLAARGSPLGEGMASRSPRAPLVPIVEESTKANDKRQEVQRRLSKSLAERRLSQSPN